MGVGNYFKKRKKINYETFWRNKGEYGITRYNRMMNRKRDRHLKRLENKEKERKMQQDLDELDY